MAADDTLTLVNARLLDQLAEQLHTIRVAGGAIAGVDSQAAPVAAGEAETDLNGRLVTPPLVDAHLHLDLCFTEDLLPANESGTLREAIGLWDQAKRALQPHDVAQRAAAAVIEEVGFGTGAIRSHVDVGGNAELRLCEGVLAARSATERLCDIQTVAFPQDGLIRDPKARENMHAALRAGVDVVGGIPHYERTPADGRKHLEFVFELAEKYDRDIDVHIDETDDPTSRNTAELAALTIERNWQGRVTASHVCALSSYNDVYAKQVIDLLAEARINVVTNPGVNLHLQGRFDTYPKRRGLTRVRELLARGVMVAAGQDCIRDPFYPLGNGCLLDQAFLVAHADHLSAPALLRVALAMVSTIPGGFTGLAPDALERGAPASFCIFSVEDWRDLIRLRPRPAAVFHRGVLAAGDLAGESA